jgi:hypothetical protein
VLVILLQRSVCFFARFRVVVFRDTFVPDIPGHVLMCVSFGKTPVLRRIGVLVILLDLNKDIRSLTMRFERIIMSEL